MVDDTPYEGPERRTVQPLSESEIAFLRKKIRQEKTMGELALRVRSWITFVVLVVGAFTLLWEEFKNLIKAAVQ